MFWCRDIPIKRHRPRVLTTMDALKKKDADDCVSKMNYKINWLLCIACIFFSLLAHSYSLSFSLNVVTWLMLFLLLAFFVFWPGSLSSKQKYFLKFMQQQINIVGMIINAFVSWAWVAISSVLCVLFVTRAIWRFLHTWM